jgi:uncharacterized protein (TIGR03118 family)
MVSRRTFAVAPAVGAIGAAVMLVLLFGRAPAKAVTNSYIQTNLVSNNGLPGTKTDKHLVNPWGVAFFSGAPFWVNDQGTGVSELLDGKGNIFSGPPFVTIPTSGAVPSGPTGIVINATSEFLVGGRPADFIFDSLDGTITAWNGGSKAVIEVNNAITARYTGLAMATIGGKPFLYAANSGGSVDVFDGNFKSFKTAGGFVDRDIPAGLTPFGIANIDGNLYVTYAHQFASGGVVDEFNSEGVLIREFAIGGTLNEPWAVVIAPSNFGLFSNDLLIGNFGDGTISAFNPTNKEFLGQLESKGTALEIDGLWALVIGDGAPNVSNPNALYFTAGPDNQSNGLFGYILPSETEPTPSPTKRATPTPTHTKKPTPTPTKRPTPTHTKKPTPTPTKRPTPTHTKKPTPTPTKKPMPTLAKKPTPTPTKKPTPTPTKKPTPTPTRDARPTPTPTPYYYGY